MVGTCLFKSLVIYSGRATVTHLILVLRLWLDLLMRKVRFLTDFPFKSFAWCNHTKLSLLSFGFTLISLHTNIINVKVSLSFAFSRLKRDRWDFEKVRRILFAPKIQLALCEIARTKTNEPNSKRAKLQEKLVIHNKSSQVFIGFNNKLFLSLIVSVGTIHVLLAINNPEIALF